MEKNIKLYFDVDKVEEFTQLADSRFSKTTIHCFSDGSNAHTEDVEFEDLKFSADTIYDIPIKVQFTNLTSDGIGTHDKNCFNVGFIPRNDNPIRFVKNEKSNKTFLTIDGLIWNGDSKNIIDIFEKSDGKKKVSVEMAISDYEEGENGKLKIKKFIFTAICILSDSVAEACEGSDIELKFARDKKNFMKIIYADESKKKIIIDNSKESAVGWTGTWNNPERKLYVPLLKQADPLPYVKEAYLVIDSDYKDSPSTSLKYPHHKIVNGKLVVSAIGVIAAFKRAAQQKILYGDILTHLKKHDKELDLGLNFNFEDESFAKYIEKLGDDNLKDETTEIKESEIDSENEPQNKEKCDEEKHEDEIHDEEKHDEENHDEETHDEENHKDHEDHNDGEDMFIKYSTLMSNYELLKKQNEQLQSENNAYMAKIEEMKDYQELKKFKEACLEKQKKDEELAKMSQTFSEIENKGIKLNDENKKILADKYKEFSNSTAWSNFVKAFAFDNFEISKNDIIDIPNLHDLEHKKGLWD